MYKNFALLKVILWQNQTALKYLDSASAILRDYPNVYAELDVWTTYGLAYQNLLQFDRSLVFFSKMCLAAEDLEDYFHQIKCLTNKAQLEFRKGDFPKALKYALEALELIEIFTFPPQQVEVLIEVGSIYSKLSEYDLANKYFFQALKISQTRY